MEYTGRNLLPRDEIRRLPDSQMSTNVTTDELLPQHLTHRE